ncbi:MAG TPA: hypothetical protein PKD55_00035 [Bellilinea sp.]|nr:hypothetical protein [Bellilinea sp.]
MSEHETERIRQKYEEMVSRPGKFEGCAPYEAYAWYDEPEPDEEENELAWEEYCRWNGWDPDNLPDDVDEDEERYLFYDGQSEIYRWDPVGAREDGISIYKIFPELYRVNYVSLWESDQGFVYAETHELPGGVDIGPIARIEIVINADTFKLYPTRVDMRITRANGTTRYHSAPLNQVSTLLERVQKHVQRKMHPEVLFSNSRIVVSFDC